MTRESLPTPQQDTATAIEVIRTLVQAQNMRAAKQELRQLKSSIDDSTWLLLTEIANTLRFKTQDAATAKLRNLWRDNELHRDLIEACVPKQGEGQHIRKVAFERRPHPEETRPVAGNTTEAYEDELRKSERDDPGTPRPELIVDRRDYDIDAALTVRHGLCVSCRLERAALDPFTGRVVTGHGDDGLCGECRSHGRLGIPELPLGHTRIDEILARLDFLAESYGTQDPGIYRQEWRYSHRAEQGVVFKWVKTNTTFDKEAVPAPTPAPVVVIDLNGDCAKCGERRQLRDNLCTDCHPAFGGEETPAGAVLPERTTDTTADRRAGRKNNEQRSESVGGTISEPTDVVAVDSDESAKRRPRSRTNDESAPKHRTTKEQNATAAGGAAKTNAIDQRPRPRRRQPSPKPPTGSRVAMK